MAMSKEGRRAFDINSVLRGCLPDENIEKETKTDEEMKLNKRDKSLEDIKGRALFGKDSENNAPVNHSNQLDSKEAPDLVSKASYKRRSHENESSPAKKGRVDVKAEEEAKEIPDYNTSAFRKVGKSLQNLENDDKEVYIASHWERGLLSGNQIHSKPPLGLPPSLAPPTYLSQQGVNLFNPFLGLNMLQQAEVSSMLANKAQIFSDQNLMEAFGRSVSSISTPLTESFANVKSVNHPIVEPDSNSHLKNRFPLNHIVNPMVEKLIHKNTSPLLIHSPVNAANLSQNWCAKCNASFRMTSDLVYHMRSHHKREDPVKRKREETYKLKCDVCNETFKERHHLTRHMTSHL